MNNTQYANSIVLLEERVARHLHNAVGAHGASICGVCKDFDNQRKRLAGRLTIAKPDPFSDEALGQRTPEAIAQDDRQAADFGGHDPQYHAALVVICEEQGAGRYARAINLVARIWQKSPDQVLRDAVML